MACRVTSPEAFFGHQLGADRKIARWDKIIDYFGQLARESDRIIVEELGKSTEGHPFLLVTISSPANLANLGRLREISARLADPAGLSCAEVDALCKEGKAVIVQSMSLHASEIGGTQMAPELAYDLLRRDDEETRAILDNVVFLMVPCFNPDGQHMVTDWYNQTLGTDHEGSTMPWLYHKYCGHDNNRDAFYLNLPESAYLAKLMFREWYPQAYQDHHHMGSYGARLYVAPYCDPIHPNGDPLIWREHAWYGAHMAYKLEEAGKAGILNAAQYAGWAHMGFHWLTIYHNIAGMLTESASARLATPLYIHPGQLEGAHGRTMPAYAAQTNFPHPWPGGWWRLRDIVEQQKISAWALLDIAAKFKETVLHNAYQKAIRQTERGAAGEVRSYIIPSEQHDSLTARKLIKILLDQGITVKATPAPVKIAGRVYPAGTYMVDAAQPKMGVVRNLLGRTLFPDNYWTRKPDGTPMIYDTTSDTVAEYMGVEVVPSAATPGADFETLCCLPPAAGSAGVAGGVAGAAGGAAGGGWYVDPRLNDAFAVVNRLLGAGAKVWRVAGAVPCGCCELPAGAFFVEAAGVDPGLVARLAEETGVDFYGAAAAPAAAGAAAAGAADAGKVSVRRLRIGMYQRYWGGNMDEGWTRLLLEKYGFRYVTVRDAEITGGKLGEMIDVLILPADPKEAIIGPHHFRDHPRVKMMLRWIGDMPEQYRSGIGKEGVQALRAFVEGGGRIVAFDQACDLLIDACGLGVRNVVNGLDTKTYSTHGATLRVKVDSAHPLAWGMPCSAYVLSWDSPVFDIEERIRAERLERVVEYAPRDVLQSGWLIGEDKVAGKTAMVAAGVGRGQAVLIGFRPQFRSQTDGTFKLLFNCLV
jgi:hypothetical protein